LETADEYFNLFLL